MATEHKKAASATAESHRRIQRPVDDSDKKKSNGKSGHAMQAGARHYPELPFPKQHQVKPGEEHKLDPAPMYDAPHYLGSAKLKDKVAIITGGDSGIGRSVAALFARQPLSESDQRLSRRRDIPRPRRSYHQ
jgi:hypothetical protein